MARVSLHPASASSTSPPGAVSFDDVSPGDITDLLHSWQSTGETDALPRLIGAVSDDLRRIARAYFARERRGHTLEPTALVHEVYLRLARDRIGPLDDRRAFFSFAARLMRQILVDHARSRLAAKRGGDCARVDLEQAMDLPERPGLCPEELISLDDALDRLGALDPRQRQVVELRSFAGLTVPEVADVLEVSRATVERDWTFARRWLAREMSRDGSTRAAGRTAGRSSCSVLASAA